MNILITGGAGYLSPIITQFLSLCGHKIIIASRSSINTSLFHGDVSAFQIDWTRSNPLDELSFDIDCIIHAAGLNAAACYRSVSDAFNVNCLYTSKLLEYASSKKSLLFIFLSTVHVYANPLQGIIDEYSMPKNFHPYATSNFAAESAVRHFRSNHSLAASIFRLSNIFGAPFLPNRDCWKLFVNDICYQAATLRSINIKNDPDIHLDIVPVFDLCRLINFVISLPLSKIPEVINVSTGKSYSLLDIAKNVSELTYSLFSYTPEVLYSLNPVRNVQDKSLTLLSKTLPPLDPPFLIGSNMTNQIRELLLHSYYNFS